MMNKDKFKKKLTIGSANFMNNYGVNKYKVNNNEIKKIIHLAKKYSIFKIDTADSYLKNKSLYKNLNSKFKFTTKITPDIRWRSLEFCENEFERHASKLNKSKIDTLFFHDCRILLNKNGPEIYQNIENLKKRKLFKKIGISIYEFSKLNYILYNYDLDVVQSPYNILDKRIIKTGWYDKLRKQGIEIHIRSVFLQGLLIDKKIHLNKYFKTWKKSISGWFMWLKNNNISPLDYCLTDLLKYDFDRVVIGINTSKNLKEILNFKKINKNKLLDMETNDLRLIDPRKWK